MTDPKRSEEPREFRILHASPSNHGRAEAYVHSLIKSFLAHLEAGGLPKVDVAIRVHEDVVKLQEELKRVQVELAVAKESEFKILNEGFRLKDVIHSASKEIDTLRAKLEVAKITLRSINVQAVVNGQEHQEKLSTRINEVLEKLEAP